MGILVDVLQMCLVGFLGLAGILGLLAIVSPTAFAVAVSHGNRAVLFAGQSRFDRWISIDKYIIEHARLFGSIVIASEVVIWLLSSFGPDAYSKSALLITVCVSLLLGILAMSHMLSQQREIESNLAESRVDSLTKLPNRRAFDSELNRRLAQRQRQGTPLCLMIIDVDKFKTCNDTYGHLLGDEILCGVGKTLAAAAREMDVVSRLGGDEFAILLPGSNLAEASLAAERFRVAVKESAICYEGRKHTLTISSGLAEAQSDDDARSLIKRADSALYAAKEAGRDCTFRHGIPEPAIVDSPRCETERVTPTADCS